MKITHQRRRQIVPYLFLTVFTGFICWLFVGRHGMFASTIDWISQHSVIPDYFRKQFYQTKDFFPEFAAGIGGGQNIYHFSYYGLFNPMILCSYLLPFIKMSDYMIAVSFLGIVASVLLFFYWLDSHKFSMEISIAVSMIFTLASPIVFHSCRQVMFVNYMPFLCLSLIGVDRYWKNGRRGLYAAGIFLMVLTSFYFSIGGILAVCLYGISRCQKTQGKHPILKFGVPIVAAVCSAGVLLLPTGLALMKRNGASNPYHWKDLLLPDFSVERFAYSGYGIGLTAAALVVLFVGITYKCRRDCFLSAACLALLVFPVFTWALNGGLYARDKALIPLLPALLFLAAVFLQKLKQNEIPSWNVVGGILLTVFFCFVSFLLHGNGIESKESRFLLYEAGCSVVFALLYRKCRYTVCLAFPSIICLVAYGIFCNAAGGHILEKQFYRQVTDSAWEKEISDLLANEQGLFRLEQGGSFEEKKANINRIWDMRQWSSSIYSSVEADSYNKFREDVFGVEQPYRNHLMQGTSENPLFQKFMGVKYFLEQKAGQKAYDVHIQEQAAPVLYATDQLISQKAYESLSFPYNQTALMQFAVANDGTDFTEQGKKKELYQVNQADVSVSESKGITKVENGYHIQAKSEVEANLIVLEDEEFTGGERLLFAQFDVENKKETHDVFVDLAGERNKLSAKDHIYYNGNTSFTYAFRQPEGESKVKLSFSAGDYVISNLKCFIGSGEILQEDSLYQSEFQPDFVKTKGNRISGKLSVKNDGCLVTSIPYDSGFEIWIDGVCVKPQKINMAFLGAAITKGEHRVEIIYHAAGVTMGKLISCAGLLMWGFLLAMDRRRNGAGSFC